MSAMISVTSEFHISWNSVMIASPQTIMIDPRCWRIMYNCLLLISSRLATLPSDWWTSKSTLTPNRWIPLSLCPDRLLDPRRGWQQPRHISDELGGSAEDHELPGVDNECLGQKSLGHSWVAHPPLSFLQNSVSGAFVTLWFCSVSMENLNFENHASKWMVFWPDIVLLTQNMKHKQIHTNKYTKTKQKQIKPSSSYVVATTAIPTPEQKPKWVDHECLFPTSTSCMNRNWGALSTILQVKGTQYTFSKYWQIPAEASPALHLITDTSDERFVSQSNKNTGHRVGLAENEPSLYKCIRLLHVSTQLRCKLPS